MGLATLFLLGACAATRPDSAPADGAASWEIRDPDEIVTFALFDPETSGVELPHGLRFMRAGEAPIPFVQELVAQRPDVAGWAFTFIEITRQSDFLIDGRGPAMPRDGAIALWFAPVDTTELAERIAGEPLSQAILQAGGSVVGLGIWLPDREFVAYMRAKGHHAEYGEATLAQDGAGGFRGALRADGLSVQVSARPEGDPQTEAVSETQMLFSPLAGPSRAVEIAAANPSHQSCAAEWALAGSHPLGRALLFGPTYRTTYPEPLTGRVFSVRGDE
jgi:hypothetical protein